MWFTVGSSIFNWHKKTSLTGSAGLVLCVWGWGACLGSSTCLSREFGGGLAEEAALAVGKGGGAVAVAVGIYARPNEDAKDVEPREQKGERGEWVFVV